LWDRSCGIGGGLLMGRQAVLSDPAGRRFDDLRAAYRFEQAHGGVPISVRKRYEQRLNRLRAQLRQRQPAGCRLGDVLKRIGAIDDAQLQQALVAQTLVKKKWLLGEILVGLGKIDEETLHLAVGIQQEALTAGARSVVSDSVG
ncbi:MAG: hypothetical protein WBC63_05565, partial [Candidatus Bipolaricaulia bacterium]